MATGLSGPREEARMHPTSQTNSSFLIAFFFFFFFFFFNRDGTEA